MSFEPREYLRHILVETEFLIEYSQGLTFDRFDADETLRRAFVRSLEVIGEAVKKLPMGFRAQHPEVDNSGLHRRTCSASVARGDSRFALQALRSRRVRGITYCVPWHRRIP